MNLKMILTVVGVLLIGLGLVFASAIYVLSGQTLFALVGAFPAVGGLLLMAVARGIAATLSPNARLGVGSIEKLEQTGLSVNEMPQYRITLRVLGVGEREFTGVLKTLIAEHEVPALTKGTLLPVAYEPERPDKLLPVPADRMGEVQEMFDRQRVLMGLADPRGPEIHARGIKTTGVIMAVTSTGEIRHGHTGLETTVRFPGLGGALVDRSKVSFLLPSVLPQLAVGSQLEVFYLPEDDTQFSFSLHTIDEKLIR
ncbi:hypothetical protein [Corynebacterium nasicanis]|uniref:Uncharacterized protein n=1 Tax=Corynebacterium nasicanis TaxID=1448267 RepID=A0ABW1QBX3_9CORY